MEYRPVPQLASDSDLAAVSFYDSLGDGQSHASALYLQSLIAPTIKLLEDQRLLEIIDSRAMVRDARHHHPIPEFAGYLNRGLG